MLKFHAYGDVHIMPEFFKFDTFALHFEKYEIFLLFEFFPLVLDKDFHYYIK